MEAGILIEEDTDESTAAENFQGLGKTLFAGEEFHAEALAGTRDEVVGGGVVEGAKDDAELGEGAGNDERLRGLRFPVGEVRRTDKRGGGGGAVELVGGEHRGRDRDDLA